MMMMMIIIITIIMTVGVPEYLWKQSVLKDIFILMFFIPKCSTRICNKQQCSVKHNIHLINIFIDLGLHVSSPSESKRVAQGQ